MEERIAGEHVGVIHEPVVELTLLLVGGMERFPRVGATARRAKAGQSELGAVVVGHRLELVDLRDVVAGHHHRDLETLEPGSLKVLHRLHGRGERTFPADMIVGVGVGSVDRDLHIDVVRFGELLRHLGIDARTVGGELHADAVVDGVADEMPEVLANRGFAATDIDVEDLHPLQFVDDGLALLGREFARVTATRRRQAVHALQVAGVGEFPRETDRGVEPPLHLFGEAGLLRRRQDEVVGAGFFDQGHATAPSCASRASGTRKSEVASEARARSKLGQRRGSIPAASKAACTESWSASDSTSVTSSLARRKFRRRLP